MMDQNVYVWIEGDELIKSFFDKWVKLFDIADKFK